MENAYIGIDGGGTQTRFLAIDENDSEVAQLTLERGSKPNHYGVGTTVRVLDSGLVRLQDQLADSNHRMTAVYAGIAGCAKFDNIYQPVVDLLDTFSDRTELGGDIKTNFRAAADGQSGVILLAGTGSAIANFYPSGNWTVQGSLSYGAKDIVYEIVMKYQMAGWSDSFRGLLEQMMPPDLLTATVREIIKGQIDTDLLKKLNPEELSAAQWQEYALFIDNVTNRWIYKAFGRISAQQDRYPNDPVDVVFSGGLWAFDYLRKGVITGLKQNFGQDINLYYRPQRTAVHGAALLAREL